MRFDVLNEAVFGVVDFTAGLADVEDGGEVLGDMFGRVMLLVEVFLADGAGEVCLPVDV